MKARLSLACYKGPPKTLKIAIKGPKMTNLRRNKAGYTATPVACGWAGAIFEVT